MSSPITIKIKRFDPELPLPEYKSSGAAAMDLYARETVEIAAHSVGYVPLNVAIQFPEEYWLLVTARSSLHKQGVHLVNGVGVGDSDYCGDDDEYRAALLNFTNKTVVIQRGERIVQMQLMEKTPMQLVEVGKLSSKNRGGFGTTGRK